MGRKPMRLAKKLVRATTSMECKYVRQSPPTPPPQSMPKSISMKNTSELCSILDRYSKSRLL